MKNVLKPLPKSVLIPLALTTIASAIDATIQKNFFGSGTTILSFSNEDLNDVIEIVKYLKDAGLLIKGVSETIKNEAKKTKSWISWHVISYISC